MSLEKDRVNTRVIDTPIVEEMRKTSVTYIHTMPITIDSNHKHQHYFIRWLVSLSDLIGYNSVLGYLKASYEQFPEQNRSIKFCRKMNFIFF